MCWLAGGARGEKGWLFLLGKNKFLQSLSQKRDLNLLKEQALSFSHQWLKVLVLYEKEAKTLKSAWSLPKKNVPNSVIRNRLKRWGRENLKNSSLKGLILIFFSKRDGGFYKKLKRRDFDHVFNGVLEKIYREA